MHSNLFNNSNFFSQPPNIQPSKRETVEVNLQLNSTFCIRSKYHEPIKKHTTTGLMDTDETIIAYLTTNGHIKTKQKIDQSALSATAWTNLGKFRCTVNQNALAPVSCGKQQ